MILVDTSVVIDYLRTGDPRLLGLFQAHDAAICGITRAETLTGIRGAAHRVQLLAALDAFRQIDMPEATWDRVGDNLAFLRRAGVTVPLADVIIATVAIDNNVQLWTRDRQFQHIQVALPLLKLFHEPQ